MITQDRLKELLDYNSETGEFTRKGKIIGRKVSRTSIGCPNSAGYPRFQLDKKSYLSSRLAFLYMVGYMPVEVDHIDRNPKNNRWSNLRECNRVNNNGNKKAQSNNKIGLKGVSKVPSGKYISVIRKDKENHYLGLYTCPAAAHFAYQVAADKLYGEFARAA